MRIVIKRFVAICATLLFVTVVGAILLDGSWAIQFRSESEILPPT
jgi:hypothetical protein